MAKKRSEKIDDPTTAPGKRAARKGGKERPTRNADGTGSTTLTAALVNRVAELCRDGVYPLVAAAALGIPETTHYRWLARGEDSEVEGDNKEIITVPGDEPYRSYWVAITRARAEREVANIRSLNRAMVGKGKDRRRSESVVMWQLQNEARERYGHKVEVHQVDETVRRIVDVLREKLDPATFERVRAILAEEDC